MITLLDGPASGTTLALRRAPIFLRVVIDTGGKVDALDQLDDTPKQSESIHVYHRQGSTGVVFACRRFYRPPSQRSPGCICSQVAEYRLHEHQPTDDIARDAHHWRAWVVTESEVK